MAVCLYFFALLLLAEILLCAGENGTKPLILTPYLQSNQTEEARKLAQVLHDDFQGVLSYSGYFTVNEAFDSNLFFWFFPSENDYQIDPVMLWLQGGPGLSSLYGLFEEHGPFSVRNGNVVLRDYRWSRNHSVLYIDNPVGTGFSFTDGGYAENQTQIGEELHTALIQFFQLFPEIRGNHFFIIGESYAGKYIPAVAYVIHQKNSNINLKGLLINNGYVDPINQMDFGEYAYQLGFVDSFHKDQLDKIRDEVIKDIENGKLRDASFKSSSILSVIMKQSGLASVYNYQVVDENNSYYNFRGDWAIYLNREDVKKAIHVGDISSFFERDEVSKKLAMDDCVSVAPWLSELLDYYPVLLFNGQLDVIVPYVSTVNYVKKLNFTAATDYKNANRYQWKVGDKVAGYCKKGGFLHECMVRNAGHLVPFDQPKYAFDLVYKFVRNISLVEDTERKMPDPYYYVLKSVNESYNLVEKD